MRTNFLLAFLLVLGTVQAHPSNGRQRFARQEAPEEETTLESKPETEDVMMKDDMPAEVEVENEVTPDDVVSTDTEYDNEIEETEIKTEIRADEMEKDEMEKDDMKKDVMVKDDILEADTVEAAAENEVQDNKVQVKVEEASTTTTKAPIRLAPLGVTLRTATTTTTTRRTTTQSPTTTTKHPEQQADPGLLGRLGNFITGGVNNLAASTVGGNLISGGTLLAAAASPLWAPLLVGKKRRKRGAPDVSLNEIDQARSMQYYNKLILSHIKQPQNYYW